MTDLWPDSPEWPRKWPKDQRIDAETAIRIAHAYCVRAALKGADRRLLLAIAQHFPWAFPSIERLAELTDATVDSTRDRLRRLERRGVLESHPARISRPGPVTTFTLRRLTIPGLHLEAKARMHRTCAHCGAMIPRNLRKGTLYCKPSHRVAAAKRRLRRPELGTPNPTAG